MVFGVVPEGFNEKRLADIQADLKASLITIADPNTGETLQVDFNENSPFIQAINTLIANNALTWEALEGVYNQFNPNNAVGPALSGLVQLNALTRKPATPSTINLTLTGTPGTVIAAGQEVSDAQQNVTYVTDEDIIIDVLGTRDGTATANVDGPLVSLAGTVTTIITPIVGWDTVTNPTDSKAGNIEETDEELRKRRASSTEAPSVAPVEAIYSNILQLDGVTFSRILINNTLLVDARGIPGKHIAAIIVGGSDDDIADTLFLRSPAGAGFFGNTNKVLTDIQGESYDIRWTRPDPIDIEVEVDITIIDVNTFPDDGADQIAQAIIDYAIGGAPALGIVDGFEEFGFVPGEDVRQSRIYTPVNSVPGHKVTRLEIAQLGNPLGVADVPISFDEFANFELVNITVTVA